MTLLNFYSPTPRGDGSWFQMDVLGFSALMFVAHAAFWYFIIFFFFGDNKTIGKLILSCNRWCILLLVEYKDSMKISKLYKSNMFQEVAPDDEDIDVTNERHRVATANGDVIIARGLRKVYPDGKKNEKVCATNLN